MMAEQRQFDWPAPRYEATDEDLPDFFFNGLGAYVGTGTDGDGGAKAREGVAGLDSPVLSAAPDAKGMKC
jgi:hypothetical protein